MLTRGPRRLSDKHKLVAINTLQGMLCVRVNLIVFEEDYLVLWDTVPNYKY